MKSRCMLRSNKIRETLYLSLSCVIIKTSDHAMRALSTDDDNDNDEDDDNDDDDDDNDDDDDGYENDDDDDGVMAVEYRVY